MTHKQNNILMRLLECFLCVSLLRLNIVDLYAVLQAEGVEDVDKDLLKSGRHHDVHGVVQSSWLLPEIIIATLKQLYHCGKGLFLFGYNFKHLIAVA